MGKGGIPLIRFSFVPRLTYADSNAPASSLYCSHYYFGVVGGFH